MESTPLSRGHTIPLLDHGYVKLIMHMGTDETIVEAARMSTGRGFVSWSPYRRCNGCDWIDGTEGQTANCVKDNFTHPHVWTEFPRGDLGILEYLYSNKHHTPFEMGELIVEVMAPIMVFREWHRHRTQSYNEMSARYIEMPNVHYVPAPSRIQRQSKHNKQSSAEAFELDEAQRVIELIGAEQQSVYNHYDEMVQEGIAKEVARINCPVSRYSRMWAKANLRNWLGFLVLRMAPGAQFEIRQYANAVAQIIKSLWPRTYALFEEHTLHGVNVSRTDRQLVTEALHAMLRQQPSGRMPDDGDNAMADSIRVLLKKIGA